MSATIAPCSPRGPRGAAGPWCMADPWCPPCLPMLLPSTAAALVACHRFPALAVAAAKLLGPRYYYLLKEYGSGATKKIRQQAVKYQLIGDELYFRSIEGVLARCLGTIEALQVMHDAHEGVCGSHQSAHKMRWLIKKSRYHWPTMLEDCFKYYKGCHEGQKFGAVQMASAGPLNPIIKPWPFRGWGMDMIGQVNPPTSKGHKWILVAIDYFTKW